MATKSNPPDRLQVRLCSSVELIRASLDPYIAWIEEMMGVPLDQTLTLEVNAVPGDAVAERLLPIAKARRKQAQRAQIYSTLTLSRPHNVESGEHY